MDWCSVDKDYLDYLRKVGDERIPESEYTDNGKKLYKPFFTPLFTIVDLVYISQISSPKSRHLNLKNNLDFYKIYKDRKDQNLTSQPPKAKDILFGVVNLNYMFPVPKELITIVEPSKISEIRDFDSEIEKSKYINLLNKQLRKINQIDFPTKAKKLYELKENVPGNNISKRCLEFKQLEILAEKYKEEHLKNDEE